MTIRNSNKYVTLVATFHAVTKERIFSFYDKMEEISIDYKQLIEKSMLKYGLTIDEAHAVFGYTTRLFYRDLNHALDAKIVSKEALDLASLITKALEKFPNSKSSVQYRGWRVKTLTNNSFDEKFAFGKTVTSSFWSTAPTIEDAYPSSRNVILYTNKAKDITDIAFGVHFHQLVDKPVYGNETLIPFGVKFKVFGHDANNRLILKEVI